MTTIVPPAYSKVATPNAEVATVEDIWRASDAAGVLPSAVLATVEQLASRDA